MKSLLKKITIPMVAYLLLGVIIFCNIQGTSNKILFATFWALLWYAWETRAMKKEMVAQTELEQKPIVDFFYRPVTPKHDEYLRLRNSGKGVAYQIDVETIKEDDKTFEFYFKDPNLILTSGGEQTLSINAKYKNDQNKEVWPGYPLEYFLNYIKEKTWKNRDKNTPDSLIDKQKTKIIINYENALKKKYKRIFYIYDQIVKTDNRKELEVEFLREE